MNQQQKTKKFKELFSSEIEWDQNYYEQDKEYGFMSTVRLLNMAYFLQYLHGGGHEKVHTETN